MSDSTKQGWVRFYRKSMDSTVWKNPTTWFIWSWCMLKANHEDHHFPFNGKDIVVKKGSFISGLLSAQRDLPTLSPQNIRTVFTYLKSTGRITIESNNKFSLITIVKWNEYQTDNRQTNKPLTNEQQTTNKPLTTNKNEKKEKNVKKGEDTPSQIAKDFFSQGKYWDTYAELFSAGNDKEAVIEEFKKFSFYWTEKNKSGTKERWEQQNTFEVKRRLLTWFSRIKSFNREKSGGKIIRFTT